MEIIKIINNNIISSFDEKGNEIIVMGRGIGFSKNKGDVLDETMIEKIYSLKPEKTSQLIELIDKIPYEYIKVTNKVINYIKMSINIELSENIYITLLDHLNFAIDRQNKGIEFKNALLWEIKRFYNHEFLVAKEVVSIIKKELDIQLSEDEIGFIALHIVNAEIDADMKETLKITKMTHDIFNIIKYYFSIEIDENTLSYERFITHLKFFMQRTIKRNYYKEDDIEFCKFIKKQYKDCYNCAKKVAEYVSEQLNYDTSDEEIVYLTIHIKRVVDEQK